MIMNKLNILKKIINESNYIVALTGAGVSTKSGIKDFRSDDGLKNESTIPMEVLLSRDYFYSNTKEFYKFYKKYFNSSKVEPNNIHYYLKKLEDENKLKAIVTQNIDGLHSKAGSICVLELHGTTYKNHCIKCNKEYDSNYVFKSKGIPKCNCSGVIKPDVVLYGEMLPEKEFKEAIKHIENADLLLVLGSSLVVYPAAGLINYFSGKNLVIINKDKTPFDNYASLVINDDISSVFDNIK